MVRNLLSDWRNIAIGVLALIVLVLGGLVLPEKLSGLTSWESDQSKGRPISVLDVILDRESLRTLDLVLSDSPQGASTGDVFAESPAEISPRTGGVWRWHGANVIRFEATGGFNPATEYEIRLLPEQFLADEESLSGDSIFTVITDQFQVERVDVFEEPGQQVGEVIIPGDLRFNYPVDPRELLPRLTLSDPVQGKTVQVSLDTTYPSSEIAFRSAPILKQQEERELDFRIASDLTSILGNVSLPADFVQKIPVGSRVTLAVRGVTATPGTTESSIQIIFSSPVEPETVRQFLEVSPPVDYRLSGQRNLLFLTGDFAPGDTYRLTIREGLSALDQSSLSDRFEQSINIPDLEPSIGFKHQGTFLSRSGYRNLEIELVNVGRFELTVDRVYLNNLFFLFEYYSYMYKNTEYYQSRMSRALGDRLAEEEIRVTGDRNQPISLSLNLGRYIAEAEPGLYRVAVRRSDYYSGEQRWVLITDLGIVAKKGRQDFLLSVSSFQDLSAVSNARIQLLSDQNQLIAEGWSDARGMWRLPSNAGDFEENRPYMVTVEKGSDYSFLLLDSTQVDTVGLDIGGDSSSKTGYQAYLYGERDLYRPGETVKGVAVVRDSSLGVPPSMPLLFRHRDPQGRQRATTRLTSAGQEGLAEFQVEIPAYELTGPHTLELVAGEDVIGSYRFHVEEFVPDRINVEITSDDSDLLPDEDLTYSVVSNYLFGPAAAGLPVETTVRLTTVPFSPSSFQQYSFGDRERTFESREIFSEQQSLGESGQHSFQVDIPLFADVPGALEAVITARVQEQGGRGVTALLRRRIHVYPYYLGIQRPDDSLAEPGKEVTFEYVGVTANGSLTATGELRAELIRDRWHTVLRRTQSGNFRYESTRDPELLRSVSLPGGNQRGSFRFTPPEFGSYRVILTDLATGASSSLEFYASGWGYSPWAIKNPSRLEIDLDSEEYASGSTAMAQIRAPFPGKLLLTVERERVFYTQVHTLTGNTATVQIPIQTGYRPNAYVTATLVRSTNDLEAGSVARSFGAVPLFVDRTQNRLAVDLQAPEQIRPDSDLRVDIRTVPGARVTLAAIDEGILQLIAQKTASPFDYFYRKRALDTQAYDTFALALPEVPPIEGGTVVGGGLGAEGLGQFVSTEGIRRTKPVAYWSGIVSADSSGRVQIDFHVPDFQGALRLMAVAVRGDRFGSAEQLVRVRSPLVLLPTFPRFLSLEEVVSLPLTLRNDTGREGDFPVSFELTGPARVEGQARQSVRVPDGAERTIHFTLRTTGDSGEIGVRFSASGSGESAAVSADLTVRPDLPPITIRQAGRLEEMTRSFPLEGNQFRPGTITREIRVGPLPIMQFAGRLSDLLGYPYGCLEQTISQAFPLLYFDELARQWEPDLFASTSAAGFVQDGIRRLMSMQLYSGGFGMWPGSFTLYPWGSVYATHFLVEARQAGFHVADYTYDRAVDFVSSEVTGNDAYLPGNLRKTLYGLYTLARAGAPDVGSMEYVRQNRLDQLRPVDRALLSAAYAAAGNPQVSGELLRGIDDVDSVGRQTGGNLNSIIRNRALLLLALLESNPSDSRVSPLSERLSREANTHWTTQETGLVFVALGRLFRQQAQNAEYSGAVLLEGREIGRFNQESARFADIRGTGSLSIRMEPGYTPGAAFFSVSTRGIPSDEAFQPAQAGLEIRREFLTRDGQPLAWSAVKQGDLIAVRTQIRSRTGPVDNVVVSLLLPSGLEVENPRLKTTETLPWMINANLNTAYLDLRDDRVLMFTDLPANQWQTAFTLLRAVVPGEFRLPPLQAEAMYDPSIRATGPRGTARVEVRK